MRTLLVFLAALAPLALLSCKTTPQAGPPSDGQAPDLSQLQAMAARFAQVKLETDTARLSAGDKVALVKLIEASRHIDTLFMRQLWAGNPEAWKQAQADQSPLGQARASFYWMNKGPWSPLDDHAAFLPAVPARKLAGANFYPADMTKEEFEGWAKGLSPADQELARGFFSVIRRDRDGKLTAVPYSKEYAEELGTIAALFREAAAATDNATLKRYLTTRADAFLSNDYYESDVAWMDLDAPLDITIGPYETYNDELFGYKAAFEAYVNLRDDAETAKLAAFSNHLQAIEDNLPIDAQYRNPKVGAQAPIRVVQEVFSSGDAAHGVRSAAYNLPNDERVITEKGSKRVMLKNVQEAKFHNVLLPIAARVLGKKEQQDVNFDSFFTHILCHELTHGLGPHQIKVGERRTTPREELKDLYSAIEEAKADVLGLFSLQYLIANAEKLGLKEQVGTGEAAERRLYTTFLASSFRTLRFGLNEAHGRGMALQVNYLTDRKAIVVNGDGTYSVDVEKFRAGIKDLAHELLMIEAKGDRDGAVKMMETLGVARPEMKAALAKLADIPTDIAPTFVTAEKLVPVAGPAGK